MPQDEDPAARVRQFLDAQQKLLNTFADQHRYLQEALIDQQQALQACLDVGVIVDTPTVRSSAAAPPKERNGDEIESFQSNDRVMNNAV
eukprot:CAMPEP_0172686590 /NCGR_PEP_ID=MMETSP1074-20121228/21051_1 /TAXON_ID=2916 /ORGANISM="Ceratium fusus, Strain PA161109" /LENGTH=88 /DNA_ID=CAMNT_0013505919 /DNA_START=36 /DNA_END=299 /DNA_ORIENTATION=+